MKAMTKFTAAVSTVNRTMWDNAGRHLEVREGVRKGGEAQWKRMNQSSISNQTTTVKARWDWLSTGKLE